MTKHKLIDYYDSCEEDYRLLWHLNDAMAMHAGFWEPGIRSLKEALREENKQLAKLANIQPKDTVLDAGCGVGGTSIFLAKTIGCKTTGISLSEKQIEKCKQNAKKTHVEEKTEFFVMDYCKTSFKDSSFDIILAIESFCHASDKKVFFKEAKRLLKPGGRLIIADAFLRTRHPSSELTTWLDGWGGGHLGHPETCFSSLKEEGFKKILYWDVTKKVLPSSKRLYLYALFLLPLSRLLEFFRLRTKTKTANLRSAYYQYTTLKKQEWEYGILLAD